MGYRSLFLPALVLSASTFFGAVDASAQSVNVWVTTDNQKTKMKPQPATTFKSGVDQSLNTIYIDGTQTYQTIEGFGASFTDSAASCSTKRCRHRNWVR